MKGKVWRALFIDSENGFETLIQGFEKLSPADEIIVFHRNNIPKKIRNELELSPARIEWIECVDRGVKNSMDVQIISEFALRLSEGVFEEGYIVSRDKGFRPAIHYLQQKVFDGEYQLNVVDTIEYALYCSMQNILSGIDNLESRESIEHAFCSLLGKNRADSFTRTLSVIFGQSEVKTPKKDSFSAEVLIGESANQQSIATILDSPSCNEEVQDESLTDMKGIGVALAQRMKEVGITTPSEFVQAGAAKTWKLINLRDATFPLRWLYVFEAAIKGGSLRSIDAERKTELKHEVRELNCA